MTAEPEANAAIHPLVEPSFLGRAIAWSDAGPVDVDMFLRSVAALAELLPERGYVINLCHDRYRFMVGFAAALCRGQISLLPPNDAPDMLDRVASDYPDVYALHDNEIAAPPCPTLRYPRNLCLGSASADLPAFQANQTAVILFTSGSTGRPQPHARDWGTLVRSTRAAGASLGIEALAGATIVGTVPHQHSYGLESLVLLALQHGMTLHTDRAFYPEDIRARLAAARRPRILVTTPAHLRVILADDVEPPATDLVICATAPLSPQLARAAETRFAGPLFEIYGCSEAGQLAVRRTVEDDEWRCMDGIVLRQDAAGTWAGGAPIPTETMLGDTIELRDERHFRLLGRTRDMVNIAGKRTSLVHLNFQLNAIPGIEDAVFVQTEQSALEPTRRLVAFAVAPGMTAELILTALRRRIDPAFLPRPLHLVEALPRNEVGKVTQSAVAQMLSESDGS